MMIEKTKAYCNELQEWHLW